MFSLTHGRWINIHTKQAWSHTNSEVEYVCNSGTTLWALGKEGKEKRTIEHHNSL
jgi:hypothetical protein